MLFRKFDLSQFSDAFDVRAAMIYPWDQVPETPFKSAWGYLEPRKVLKPHAHHEGETFVFFSGRGVMTVSGEATEVTPGDIIYMPPLEPHTLENTSDTESLMFLTLWWEDMELLAKKERLEAERTASRRPTLVISSPPTPNGYLHLGHLAGPYLSGDFHARYLRLRGTDVRFITHSDDNESYVRLRASQHGWTPQEGADHFADSIEASFAAAQIQPDFFLRPNHTPNHRRMVERLFLRLWEKGELVPRAMDVPYCETCDQYRLECYVRGKCPHCGEGADGFVCESCLWPIDATELLERRCTECSTPTVDRPLTRLFFQPSRHRDALARWYRGSELPPRVRELCERMLAEKLPDVALTQTVGWGTPVPIPGYEGQTIYGAFEIFVAFLVNCQVMAGKEGLAKEEDDFGWQRFYGSPDADVVQFFGADNNYFFAINYPAISLALDLGLQMPARLVPNEFYLLEGKKFSTVRKHLIRLEELKDDVPIDVVRCYLAMTSPETERTNFERAELDRLWQRELRGNWQTWLTDLAAKVRALTRMPGGGRGIAPAPSSEA